MNKKDLVTQVKKRTGLTNPDVLIVIEAVLDTLQEGLEQGETIMLRNFGTFSITSRKERRGVNPVSLQPIVIPAYKTVKFTLSKAVKL